MDLLRLTFPQLVGDDKKINMYKSDRSRKLQKLKMNTLTPEEIYRSMRSTGSKKSVLYVKLKVRKIICCSTNPSLQKIQWKETNIY